MSNTYRLGVITAAQAQMLMGAPAVAGGWVMIPTEAANRVRLWDWVSGHGAPFEPHYLAALPSSWDEPMRPIDGQELLAQIDRDIEATRRRNWSAQTVVSDLDVLLTWRERIVAVMLA